MTTCHVRISDGRVLREKGPFLTRFPIIGYCFRVRSRQRDTSNVVAIDIYSPINNAKRLGVFFPP